MAVFNGDAGPNEINGAGEADSISGLGGNDTLLGYGAADTLRGGDGNDVLIGGEGDDLLDGGSGTDAVIYYRETGTRGVVVNLTTGQVIDSTGNTDTLISIEQIHGSNRGDTLIGSVTAGDMLLGWGGDDLIQGMGGNDTMAGGEGNDSLYGGDGIDQVNYFQGVDSGGNPPVQGVNANLQTGIATDGFGDTDALSSIERLFGTSFGDTLTGSDSAGDLLSGEGGNDVIYGGGGDDSIIGGAGNDTLAGGAGSNRLLYALEGGTRGVFVNLATGTATDSFGNSDVISGFDNIFGTAFDDTIYGSTRDDERLFGGAGNDVLDGRDGNNLIYTGSGNDTVYIGTTIVDARDTVVIDGSGNKVVLGGPAQGTEYGHHIDFDLGEAVTVNLATGIATSATMRLDFTQARHFLEVAGTSLSDSITGGNPLHDYLEWFTGNKGNDTIDGGSGTGDTIVYDREVLIGAPDAVTGERIFGFRGVQVRLDLGWAIDSFGDTDTLISIDQVHGTKFADLIVGDSQDNGFWSLEGNDTIDGRGGIDRIHYTEDSAAGGLSGVTVDLINGIGIDGFGNTDTLIGIEHVHGTIFTDYMQGNDQDNWLFGYDGNDTLISGGGLDILDGGAGNDSLSGQAGDDELWGQAGNDTLNGGAGQDAVRYVDDPLGVFVNLATGFARDGYGTVDTLISIERAHGSAKDDTILGDGQANQILGYAGNDSIAGGGGADTLLGGAGNDTVLGGAGDDELWAGAGNDLINGEDGTDLVRYLDALAGVVIDLQGGTAQDGSGGIDTLLMIENAHGSDFGDTIQGSAGGNQLGGYAGNDSLLGLGGSDTLLGGDGSDTLRGGDGNDELWGEAGNDVLDGGAGIDVARYFGALTGIVADLSTGRVQDGFGSVDALTAIEGIYGSEKNDTMFGAATNDLFAGFGGNDSLSGAAGKDTLLGGDGNDVLLGGDGDDELWGEAGDDTINGEAGLDLVRYRNAVAGVAVNLATGLAADGSGGTDRLLNVENVDGSTFDDAITGDGLGNRLFGYEGDDTLAGGGGADTLVGGLGNDSILGGEGDDELWGDAGNDTIDGGAGAGDIVRYRTVGGSVRVDLDSGLTSDGQGGTDTVLNVEHVDGSDHADVMLGNAAGNRLFGYLGADVISGRGGNDTILAGEGDDSILGGDGDDEISGELGNDTIDGGAGTDVVRYRTSTAGVVVNLAAGFATDGLGGTDVLRSIENVHGSDLGDVLTGTAEINGLFGYDGADTLYGSTGNDSLIGGLGGDTYLFGAGDGRDVIIDLGAATGGGDSLVIRDYSSVNATVRVQGTAILIDFGATSDSVTIVNGTLDAGRIESVSFADGVVWSAATLIALSGKNGTAAVNNPVTGGNDSLFGTTGANSISGGLGDDKIYGLSGDDLLTGDAGNDSLYAGDGNDRAYGGGGDDMIFLGAGAVTVDGGAGTDIAVFDSSFANMTGLISVDAAGVATVAGNRLSNIEIFRFADRDVGAAELLELSRDSVPVSALPATLSNTEGAVALDLAAYFTDADGDTLIFSVTDLPAGLRLEGSVLRGQLDAALVPYTIGIIVTDGQHELRQTLDWRITNINVAPTGEVTLSGAPVIGQVLSIASTVADFDGIAPGTQTITWLRNGVAITGATAETYQLADADFGATISVVLRYTDTFGAQESVTSNAISGITAPDLFLTGTADADTLRGGLGDDTVFGLAGNDLLEGFAGNDELNGGDGNDTISGSAGDDLIFGGSTEADLRDVIYGGDGNDTMDGGAGNDDLNGGAGRDSLIGGLGADLLIGNQDNDTLIGSGGADALFGNDGNDFINGGFGYDRINGGAGADIFFHLGVAEHGSDWVQDYTRADGDVLSVGIAGATLGQFQVNTAFSNGAGAFDVAEAFVIYRPTGQILWALVDGAGQGTLTLNIGGSLFDLVI